MSSKDTHLLPMFSPRITFGRAVRAETRRLRHSFLLPLHLACALVAGGGGGAYFAFAAWNPTLGADAFVQLLGAMMPLMVGIIGGIDADLEGEVTRFSNLVAQASRWRVFAARVFTLWMLGALALGLAVGVFAGSLQLTGRQSLEATTWIGTWLGLSLGSVSLYLILYVAALKWGRNASIAVGAVGLMLAFFSMGGLAHGLVTGKLTASELNVFSVLPTSWPALLGALPIELAVAWHAAGDMASVVLATWQQATGICGFGLVICYGGAAWWIRRFEPRQSDA
ncbi:lantibiotic ABC transporter permease [Mobiluncus mulieris]|uniref:lantibiotic ABC transporter permease n=1 Tax=Mobiluncus mulieris TaxID=2052 RepID=UPI00242D3C31|nr:lantibiotic ABC transporter permease [Mobiluncus mulieris]